MARTTAPRSRPRPAAGPRRPAPRPRTSRPRRRSPSRLSCVLLLVVGILLPLGRRVVGRGNLQVKKYGAEARDHILCGGRLAQALPRRAERGRLLDDPRRWL